MRYHVSHEQEGNSTCLLVITTKISGEKKKRKQWKNIWYNSRSRGIILDEKMRGISAKVKRQGLVINFQLEFRNKATD
jgi:hypothetical protein